MKRKPIGLEVEDKCLMDWSERDKRWTCYLFCWEVWKSRKRRVMRTVTGRTQLAVGHALDTFTRKRGVTLMTSARRGGRGAG